MALRLRTWHRGILAFICGLLTPLSFAPYDLWPVAILTVGIFASLLQRQQGWQTLMSALCFGLGLYGSGVSWVFISIHNFGASSLPLALALTALFVLGMAIIFSLPFYIQGRWFRDHAWAAITAFTAIWTLGEWFRSWVFTGFPWLYLGYGHLQSPLAGWAPVLGIFGLGLLCAFTSASLAYSCNHFLKERSCDKPIFAVCLALTLVLWGSGAIMKEKQWTQATGKPISVALVQPNIPQELKWKPSFRNTTLERLLTMSEPLWQEDWLVWPEAVIPIPYHDAEAFLEFLRARAEEEQTAFTTGILYDDREQYRYFNSTIGLGEASGRYLKQRLVPFGEYVPLEQYLRGLIAFFDLPTSIIYAGPKQQSGLVVKGVKIAPLICYEVAYPDLAREGALSGAEILLTISNDAWFGDSIGPLQHMQIAQMRALESGRYLVRATNNGVSAFVDPQGRITHRTQQFQQETLVAEIEARSGNTPFLYWGSYPVLFVCLLLLALLRLAPMINWLRKIRQQQSPST